MVPTARTDAPLAVGIVATSRVAEEAVSKQVIGLAVRDRTDVDIAQRALEVIARVGGDGYERRDQRAYFVEPSAVRRRGRAPVPGRERRVDLEHHAQSFEVFLVRGLEADDLGRADAPPALSAQFRDGIPKTPLEVVRRLSHDRAGELPYARGPDRAFLARVHRTISILVALPDGAWGYGRHRGLH